MSSLKVNIPFKTATL